MEPVSIVVRAWREAGEVRVRVSALDEGEDRTFVGAARAGEFVAEMIERGLGEQHAGDHAPRP